SEVQRGGDCLLRVSAETQAARGPVLQADASLRGVSGVLEGSDVNAVGAMSGMIASARRFGMQMKVISRVDGNAGRATQLLSM
ncbi:flagellar biosynthesis protein FlgF, partial [Escherichia coli]|uniref:flagellar basal body rod C-terminal domain-containing protein n=1 Tax=Escherichia coli TaxID=562 RepID=UPI000CAD9A28